jgi:hypothetical protein
MNPDANSLKHCFCCRATHAYLATQFSIPIVFLIALQICNQSTSYFLGHPYIPVAGLQQPNGPPFDSSAPKPGLLETLSNRRVTSSSIANLPWPPWACPTITPTPFQRCVTDEQKGNPVRPARSPNGFWRAAARCAVSCHQPKFPSPEGGRRRPRGRRDMRLARRRHGRTFFSPLNFSAATIRDQALPIPMGAEKEILEGKKSAHMAFVAEPANDTPLASPFAILNSKNYNTRTRAPP